MHLRQTSPVEKMFNEVNIPSFLEFRNIPKSCRTFKIKRVFSQLKTRSLFPWK